MSAYYSLRQIKTDGVVTAPRWMQHTVKVMTSLSAFVALLVVGLPIVIAGWLASAVLYGCVWIKERLDPTDMETYTVWQHVADTMTDAACAGVTLAAAYAIVRAWPAALVVLAVCVAGYVAGHKDARP